MAAGGVGGTVGWQPPNQTPIAPSNPMTMFGNPATFTAGATTQAGDYDKIMKNYADIAAAARNTVQNGQVVAGQTPNPTAVPNASIGAQQAQYQQSGDVTGSLANLSDLSTTGGYNAQGIADLRARGIAPTRSIYANAQENVNRARALGGGYSPNANAVQAKMARDESSQISDINTNVNAGIAQNVASNRIAAAPQYASASANANAAKTESDRHNADIINQINSLNAQNAIDVNKFNVAGQTGVNEANANRAAEAAKFNATTKQGNLGTQLAATQGQANLYGTTPALTNTFGNQVVQAAQLGQNQQGLNQQKNRDTLGFSSSMMNRG